MTKLNKCFDKEQLAAIIQAGFAAPGAPSPQTIQAEISGYIPNVVGVLAGAANFGTAAYDFDEYGIPEIQSPEGHNPNCGPDGEGFGTLVINPNLPEGSSQVVDITLTMEDDSGGAGSLFVFCPATGQVGQRQGIPGNGLGTNVGGTYTFTFNLATLSCPVEDVRFGITAWGNQGSTEGRCDELGTVETLTVTTPSVCDPVDACFTLLFGCPMADAHSHDFDEDTFYTLLENYLEEAGLLPAVVDTDDQTLNTTVAGGATTQITISEGNTVDILHPEHECPQQMTRGQLLSLRNSGNLDMSCHYLIPKTGNGCLGDVVIELHPVGPDKLSDNVSIHTEHDTEAWLGQYDISENQIQELKDNRGNRVRADNQTEVNRFPWGNPNWTGVTVENATVQVECDTALRVLNTHFHSNASVDLRGATGLIYYSRYDSQALMTLNGAQNVNIQGHSMESRARVYGERSTNLQILYSGMESESYWLFRDRTDVRAIYSSFSSASRVYFTAGDRQWMYYTTVGSYAHIRQSSGTLQIYYSDFQSYGEYRHEAGAGIALLYGISLSSRAYVRNFNTVRWRSYHDHVSSRGEILLRGDNEKITYYNHVSSYGWLHLLDASTVVYGSDVGSQARFIVNGGNHYRNRFGSYARVTTAFNTRSIYADGSFAQTLTAANSNTYRGFGVSTLV